MTLTAETAKKLQETAEQLVVMKLREDHMLAAAILMRLAADYAWQAARKADGADAECSKEM